MGVKKGLAIGINNYPKKLAGCAEDALAFAEIMSRNDDGKVNFAFKVPKDVKNKAELRGHIRDLFTGDEETVLLYFSGHGILDETGGYIIAPDYDKLDPGIPMNEILTLANQSNSANKIILLDCCNSGSFAVPPSGGNAPEITNGVTILTASREDEPAYQVNGRGIFTSLLLNALKGAAADLNGYITPGGVYTYIDQSLGPWDRQRPVFKTNISQFTVLREIEPRVERKVIRNIVKYFNTPGAEYKLNPSYEFTNTKQQNGKAIEPYAMPENVAIFKELQKLQSVGLVAPVDAEFMYFAAMDSKSCKLTMLGQHYWRLVDNEKIR